MTVYAEVLVWSECSSSPIRNFVLLWNVHCRNVVLFFNLVLMTLSYSFLLSTTSSRSFTPFSTRTMLKMMITCSDLTILLSSCSGNFSYLNIVQILIQVHRNVWHFWLTLSSSGPCDLLAGCLSGTVEWGLTPTRSWLALSVPFLPPSTSMTCK